LAVELERKEGQLDSGDDQDLVLRAKQGDHAAFDALHAKHAKNLTRYCARLLHNNEESENAAQDAFTAAWSNLSSFQGGGLFESWLKSIATNVCLHLLRTKKGKDTLQRQSLDDPATLAGVERRQAETGTRDPVEEEVGTHLLAQQIIDRILTCVQTAKPRWDALDLDIFELYYVQGVETKREVAERLGENENKVKYRLYNRIEPVIAKVRKQYEDEDKNV